MNMKAVENLFSFNVWNIFRNLLLVDECNFVQDWVVLCNCRILHNHMKKLGKIITPNHKDLRIPKMYHYECPWPAAQSEIYMINAYKVRIFAAWTLYFDLI